MGSSPIACTSLTKIPSALLMGFLLNAMVFFKPFGLEKYSLLALFLPGSYNKRVMPFELIAYKREKSVM
ncbi:MAG: hypothetical protein ACI4JS_07160 [Oscillospiraceae bacterium]